MLPVAINSFCEIISFAALVSEIFEVYSGLKGPCEDSIIILFVFLI